MAKQDSNKIEMLSTGIMIGIYMASDSMAKLSPIPLTTKFNGSRNTLQHNYL